MRQSIIEQEQWDATKSNKEQEAVKRHSVPNRSVEHTLAAIFDSPW